MSKEDLDISSLNLEIPVSLRPIHPFLYDAFRGVTNIYAGESGQSSRKKAVIACVNSAYKLLNVLNLELDGEAMQCLRNFELVRTRFVSEIGLPPSAPELQAHVPEKPPRPSHEILIAEADEVLSIAEILSQEGLQFEAVLSYHTASVYYRVMESMLPTLAGHVHQRLMYAAWRSRLGSALSHNFVREHFDGLSCADVYEVHGSSKLGKGSYGSVYLATHRVTGDERAVKVMNVDKVTSYYLRKLHTEVSILKVLDHPNIVKLQDVFFGKRSVYIVTDLCRGGELFELLNSGKNQGFVFREDRASRLMRDMISAVHYLHSKGIVHRDLKLENFLFETKTSSSSLVLIDFGLSKHFQKDEVLSQRVGSCYYTAPEVLRGGYDYRCDVWSLGVLCYMLLSGSPPFHGKGVEDVYQATLTQEPVFPDKKFRHLSPACMDFMQRLLVKDPARRMSTAAALQHPFITGGGMAASRPSLTTGVAILPPLRAGGGGGVFPASAAGVLSAGAAGSDAWSYFPAQQADDILRSALTFASLDPLSRLVLLMVAHTFSPEALCEPLSSPGGGLRQEFQLIDTAHAGAVTLAQFAGSLRASSMLSRGEVGNIGALFAALCMQGSVQRAGGELLMAYREYIAAAMVTRVEVEDCRIELIFANLDQDSQGYITMDSIRKALGEAIAQEALDAMGAAGAEGAGVPGGAMLLSLEAFQAHWARAKARSDCKRAPAAGFGVGFGAEFGMVGMHGVGAAGVGFAEVSERDSARDRAQQGADESAMEPDEEER